MKIHAAMRRAVDLNNRGLKQNYDRDTTCVLRAVCEYKPLSHPHHCCQITSNLGSALAKGLATASRETTGFTEAPPSRRLSKTAAAARTALPTTRSTDQGGRARTRRHQDARTAPPQPCRWTIQRNTWTPTRRDYVVGGGEGSHQARTRNWRFETHLEARSVGIIDLGYLRLFC